LYFTDKPPPSTRFSCNWKTIAWLDIPAGEKHFVVTDDFTLPVTSTCSPSIRTPHYLGKDLQAIAKFSDGRSETLIHIPIGT